MSKLEGNLRSDFSQHLSLVETVLYAGVSVLLGAVALATLLDACIKLWRGLVQHAAMHEGIMILDDLLLVLMLIEVLHTVRISIRTQALTMAPFLVVGLIASIRRILVITMQAAEQFSDEGKNGMAQQMAFRNSMIELGLLGFLILVFIGSIYFLSRTSRAEQLSVD